MTLTFWTGTFAVFGVFALSGVMVYSYDIWEFIKWIKRLIEVAKMANTAAKGAEPPERYDGPSDDEIREANRQRNDKAAQDKAKVEQDK